MKKQQNKLVNLAFPQKTGEWLRFTLQKTYQTNKEHCRSMAATKEPMKEEGTATKARTQNPSQNFPIALPAHFRVPQAWHCM